MLQIIQWETLKYSNKSELKTEKKMALNKRRTQLIVKNKENCFQEDLE